LRRVAILIATAAPALACAQSAPSPALVETAIDRGRLVQASEMLGIAERSGAPLAGYALAIARLAEARGDHGGAFLYFGRAVEREPANCAAHEGQGVAALRLGRVNAARRALAAGAEACPAVASIWIAAGVAADRAGDWAASEAAYARAAALSPDNPRLLNNRGYSLLIQRRYADAVPVLERAARLAPGNRRIANNLDLARSAAGLPIDLGAANQAERATRLNNAGYAAWLAGRPDAARTYLTDAIQSSASHHARAEGNLDLVNGGER
jgi:Flp pilus assembly protein TadD